MKVFKPKLSYKQINRVLKGSRESLYLEGIEGLSRRDACEYHSKVLAKGAEGRDFIVAADDDGSFAGMAAFERLKWDSKLLGVRVAKINLIVTGKGKAGRRGIYAVLLNEVFTECWNRGIRLIYFRNPAANSVLNRYLSGIKIHPVSRTVNLFCPANRMKGRDGKTGVSIRGPYRSEYPQVERLMEMGYKNRLLREPALRKERVRRLYREWVRNDLRGRVEKVLICVYKDRVTGFVALDRVGINKKIYGFIDMIVVDPKARRKGVGSLLMGAAAERLRKRAKGIFLGTEGDGPETVNFYKRLGFRAAGSSYFYHIKPEERSKC